jgi:TolB-like protein/Tfp pilus assembly protein PilF
VLRGSPAHILLVPADTNHYLALESRRIQLMGAIEVPVQPGCPSMESRPKTIALIAWLIAHADDGPKQRNEITSVFWPEVPDAQARNSLRQHLHQVRKALGDDALVKRGDAIAFSYEAIPSDLAELDVALRHGDDLAALQAYRGELMHGIALQHDYELSDWLDRAREQRRRAVVGCCHRLVAAAQRVGDVHGQVRWARRGLELVPPWERDRSPFAAVLAQTEHLASSAPVPLDTPTTIAVAPFTALSTDEDVDVVAVTAARALAETIARLNPNTRVAGPAGLRDAAGRSLEMASLSPSLGASGIVLGMVSQSPDGFRVGVQLVSANLRVLWTGEASGAIHEAEWIGAHLAARVLAALEGVVPVDVARRVGKHPDAVVQVLRGIRALQLRRPESMASAISYFRSAIELDASHAPAWSGLGLALLLSTIYGFSQASHALPEALASLDRAIGLDPVYASSFAARGATVALWRNDKSLARKDFAEAHRIDPNEYESWIAELMHVHAPAGDAAAALHAAARISELAPLDATAIAYAAVGVMHFDAAQARTYAQRALTMDAGSVTARWTLASLECHRGAYPEALAHVDVLIASTGEECSPFTSLRACILATAGDHAQADVTLASASRTSHVGRYYAAIATGLVGAPQVAIEALIAERESGSPLLEYAAVDPHLDALREHPGFMQLLPEQFSR